MTSDKNRSLDPEMAVLEQKGRNPVILVDLESIDVSDVLPLSRCHRTSAADLDLALRDPVKACGDVRVVVGRPDTGVDATGPESAVVGHRRDVLDPHLPVRIGLGLLADSQVSRGVDRVQLINLGGSAVKRDLVIALVARTGPIYGHQPREVTPVGWLDDEMGHRPLRGVDHHVGKLAGIAVRTADLAAKPQSHRAHVSVTKTKLSERIITRSG